MRYLVNAEQMKAIDTYSIEQIGIPSLVLMEKAAMQVADAVLLQAKKEDKIIAVCGAGNNGGDGIAAARILKEAGLNVSVLFAGEEDRATKQTKKQLEIGSNLELSIINDTKPFNKVELSEYTIIIDAVFGIGLSKPITGKYESLIKNINEARARVFSVDVPSGISADTGAVMGTAVKADVTVTFGYTKLGLILYPGADYAGKVITADIGFPKKAEESVNLHTFVYDREDKKRLPPRMPYSNKGTYGKVLVIAGSKNMAGAAYFAAKSAYLCGAGLVKILTCEENRTILQNLLPEALLTTYSGENIEDAWFLKELSWATTIVIGPGISEQGAAEKMVDLVLLNSTVPTVMDADALNLLAKKDEFYRIFQKDHFIITPHLKEMSRLVSCEVRDIICDIPGFTRNLSKDKRFVLVLKDARTFVVKDNKTYVNTTGNSGMAAGGSGDILSGMTAGLLAQGMDVFEAAKLSVYLHGCCGDEAAADYGEYAMTAQDIIEKLKAVVRVESYRNEE